MRKIFGPLFTTTLAAIVGIFFAGHIVTTTHANPAHIWVVNDHVAQTLGLGFVDLRSPSSRDQIRTDFDNLSAESGGQVPDTSTTATASGETWVIVEGDGSGSAITLSGRGLTCAEDAADALSGDDATVPCDGIAQAFPDPADNIAIFAVVDAGTAISPVTVTATQDAVSLDSAPLTIVGQATDMELTTTAGRTALASRAPSCNDTDDTSDARRAEALATFTDANGIPLVGYRQCSSILRLLSEYCSYP